MAFATSNLQRTSRGDRSGVAGTWTASAGDAAGTMTFSGPVLKAEFFTNLTSGAQQPRIRVSGLGTTTLTIYHQGTVTNGKLDVEFKG